ERPFRIGQWQGVFRARVRREFVTASVVFRRVQIDESIDAAWKEGGKAGHLAARDGESNERRALDSLHIHEGTDVVGQSSRIVARLRLVRLSLAAACQPN